MTVKPSVCFKVRWATEAALLCGLRHQASVANIVSDCLALRLQPNLGHGTVDQVPLNPFAFRAGKGRKSWPAALGSIAVSFMGEPHAQHCGRWFCASSIVDFRSIRRFEFAGKPAKRIGFHRVTRNNHRVGAAAVPAVERPVFGAGRPRFGS
jgi:hypothetical protein